MGTNRVCPRRDPFFFFTERLFFAGKKKKETSQALQNMTAARPSFALTRATCRDGDAVCVPTADIVGLLSALDARVDLSGKATVQTHLRMASVFRFATREALQHRLTPWCIDPAVTYRPTAKTFVSITVLADWAQKDAVEGVATVINTAAETTPLVIDEPEGPTYTVATVEPVWERDAEIAGVLHNIEFGLDIDDSMPDGRWVRLCIDLVHLDVAANHDLVLDTLAYLTERLAPCAHAIPSPRDPGLAVSLPD